MQLAHFAGPMHTSLQRQGLKSHVSVRAKACLNVPYEVFIILEIPYSRHRILIVIVSESEPSPALFHMPCKVCIILFEQDLKSCLNRASLLGMKPAACVNSQAYLHFPRKLCRRFFQSYMKRAELLDNKSFACVHAQAYKSLSSCTKTWISFIDGVLLRSGTPAARLPPTCTCTRRAYQWAGQLHVHSHIRTCICLARCSGDRKSCTKRVEFLGRKSAAFGAPS